MNNQNCVEIIPKKLYWISDKYPPKNLQNSYFFCTDNDLVYEPFFSDFGPLNLGLTHRFIIETQRLMKDQANSNAKIYHYTSTDGAKKANSAVLICAYAITILNMKADEIWAKFKNINTKFLDYRDASYGICEYNCKIIDVLRGLEYAKNLNWYNVATFNLKDYEYFERVQNGDINWIIPGKFWAFSGPQSVSRDQEGNRNFTPEDYLPIFKNMKIGSVVRLNNKVYDENRFKKNNILHYDLYFTDGSIPSMDIINKFLQFSEKNLDKGIAIHCKAGLGRTGTLIGCFAMKHYRFQAAAFIGWIRLCRPGSILGPQQDFLNSIQKTMFEQGKNSEILQQVLQMNNSNVLNNFFEKQILKIKVLNKNIQQKMVKMYKVTVFYRKNSKIRKIIENRIQIQKIRQYSTFVYKF